MALLSKLKTLFDFIKARKRWWLTPIIGFILFISLLLVLTEGSAIAPFIYTLF